MLAGLPANPIRRLQSVFNAAARLVFSLRKYDRVTPLLQQLHWLKVKQRIEYKLPVLAFRCLHGLAPPYLANDPQCVSNLDARRRLLALSSFRRRVCSPSATVPFLSLLRGRGTVYQTLSRRHRRCPRSNVVSRLYFSLRAITEQLRCI